MPALLEASASVSLSPTHRRQVRIGLLGLGQVGQAVARLASSRSPLHDAGFEFRITGALVRDVAKPRRCVRPARVTTNPSAFLRGQYDVVVEALGAVEPSRTIIRRLLGRGVPVVTANKALVAAHGPELGRLAAARGTTLRYEASALAGVPFLGAFEARPLVSDVRELVAVVNGTSNFLLSMLASDACAFATALDQARLRGLTEPDATRDVDGLDAADKLALLSSLFGWGVLSRSELEVDGIRGISAIDLRVVEQLGATIKPVVFASRSGDVVNAFVGPAVVSAKHPLASLRDTQCGIQLKGRFVSELFFSGPGAGPEVTAATILDDVVESLDHRAWRGRVRPAAHAITCVTPPLTPWLVRVTFPGIVPDASTVTDLFALHDCNVAFTTDAVGDTRWVQVGPDSRERLAAALTRINTTHRLHTSAIRIL